MVYFEVFGGVDFRGGFGVIWVLSWDIGNFEACSSVF